MCRVRLTFPRVPDAGVGVPGADSCLHLDNAADLREWGATVSLR